jgi:hypothetical protein
MEVMAAIRRQKEEEEAKEAKRKEQLLLDMKSAEKAMEEMSAPATSMRSGTMEQKSRFADALRVTLAAAEANQQKTLAGLQFEPYNVRVPLLVHAAAQPERSRKGGSGDGGVWNASFVHFSCVQFSSA